MLLSEVDYELSIRLGDPVETPETDGMVFSSKQRLRYITRAYSKLTRMLRILMRDYQPEFNKNRTIKTYKVDADESIVSIDPVINIDEIFVKYEYKNGNTTKTETAICVYMEPKKFLSNKYGLNDVKAPTFADGKFKYSLMIDNGVYTLMLLPEVTSDAKYLSVEILEVPDLSNYKWDSWLPITKDYLDILIDLATIQGMQDIARGDKAQLIERSIDREWQVLGQYGAYMKQVEGVKE